MLLQNSYLQELHFSLHKNAFSYCFVKKVKIRKAFLPNHRILSLQLVFFNGRFMVGLYQNSAWGGLGTLCMNGKRRSEWVKVNIQNKGTVERGFVSKGVAGVENGLRVGLSHSLFPSTVCLGTCIVHEWTGHLSNRLAVTPVSTFKSPSLNILELFRGSFSLISGYLPRLNFLYVFLIILFTRHIPKSMAKSYAWERMLFKSEDKWFICKIYRRRKSTYTSSEMQTQTQFILSSSFNF